MFFSVIAAKITADSVRDTVFLINFEKSFLPLMYIAIGIVMAAAIYVYKRISSNRDQISIITYAGLIFSASLIVLVPILSGIIIPLFYVWVEVITVISILQFWILAGEVTNPRDAKRLFPLIGVGGSLAGIGAGLSIDPFVQIFGSDKLLFLTSALIGFSVLSAQFLRPFYHNTNVPKFESLDAPKVASSFGPYIKHIAILIGVSAFLSKVVDYQFKMTAASTYPVQDELVSYFGLFYTTVGIATLIMQVFLTSYILRRFGILAGLLILPIAIGVGSSAFLLLGTLAAVFIAKFSDQLFKFSTNNAAQELLWLPVDQQKKKKVKPVIDGTIRSGLEGLAGLMIFAFVSFELIPIDKLHWLSIPVIAGVLFWLWNNIRLRDGYIGTLVEAIDDRRLNLENIEYDIKDSHVISTIDGSLRSEDEHTQLFGLNLLESLPIDPWRSTLNGIFHSGTHAVKQVVLRLSIRDETTISNQELLDALCTNENLTPDVIICLAARKIPGLTNTIRPYMYSDDVSVKVVSAVQILESDSSDTEAQNLIMQHLNSNETKTLCQTLQFFRGNQSLLEIDMFQAWLSHGSQDVRNEALRLLAFQSNSALIDDIIQNLESPRTWKNAIVALKNQDDSKVQEAINERLIKKETSNDQLDGIIRGLPNLKILTSTTPVINLLSSHNLELSETISNTLLAISRQSTLDAKYIADIDKKIMSLSKQAYVLEYFLDQIENGRSANLIVDQIRRELGTIVPLLLKLGALEKPSIPIETYVHYISAQDPVFLPLVLETVDSTFSAANRKSILPLIDSAQDKVKISIVACPELAHKYDDIFDEWLSSGSDWKLAIGLHYAITTRRTTFLGATELSRLDECFGLPELLNREEYRYLRDQASRFNLNEQKEVPMYSIIEKTFFLKTVELFREIPGDILADIAQISKETRLESNRFLFKEGEHGDHMFVVVTGKVSILRGGNLIAEQDAGSCIGEMAILDHEPRSADAKTSAETVLLKIHHDGFYQLMASNPKIMQEIVKMLTNRIRQLNETISSNSS